MVAIWFLLCLFNLPFRIDATKPTPLETTCDPEWFGRPENQDCKDVLARLPDWGTAASLENDEWGTIREFVNFGAVSGVAGGGADGDVIRTPLVMNNGER